MMLRRRFTVVPAGDADISTTLTCRATLVAGHARTCTLTIADAGPATATRIHRHDPAPEPASSVLHRRCTRHGTTVTLVLPTLASGASSRIALTLGALFPGRAPLVVTAEAREPDPNPANNTARQAITVIKHRP